MRMIIIFVLVLVSACDNDHRSRTERVRDDVNACKEMGGLPIMEQNSRWGAYMKKCQF
jgi:hypothetical protein